MKKLLAIFGAFLFSVSSAFSFEGIKSDFINDAFGSLKNAFETSESEKDSKNHFSVNAGYNIWDDFQVVSFGLAFDTKFMTYKADFGTDLDIESLVFSGSILFNPIKVNHFELGLGATFGWYEYQEERKEERYAGYYGYYTDYYYYKDYKDSFFFGIELLARFPIISKFGLQSDIIIPFSCDENFSINFGAFYRF